MLSMPHQPRSRQATRGSACARRWTGLTLILALSITYGLWSSARNAVERDRRAYFDLRVRDLRDDIEDRLENYRQVLYGTRGLFAASIAVERAEFHAFVSALALERRYPGVQGVGFSLIVPRESKTRHVDQVRRQGFPDYDIYPAGERAVYTSILYLEPFAGRNLRAFGYDMYSEPVRNQAMTLARDTDRIAVSGKVILVQETDEDVQAGFLMYLPVYRNDLSHDTLEQRRSAIVGWVYSPFRMNDLMRGIGGEQKADLQLEIFDGEQEAEASRLFGSPANGTDESSLRTTQHVLISGHPWTLVIRTAPGFQSRLDATIPLVIAGTGTALSVILALLIGQFLSRGRALALADLRARELQESEARFRLMANSAPVFIWLADADKAAIWFNSMWLEFTGRTMAQELEQGWIANVHPDDLELVRNCYEWNFNHRLPFSVEYRLRRHDGEYRWISDRGVPRFDETGHFAGFIGSCVDINDRKLMEEELLELATKDSLTGFLNRRYFLVRLQEEFARVQRNPQLAASVLMLDLDHFKRVNDTYGHACGDALLRHFAEIVRSQLRKVDLVGRMGGEEFAIVLPDTDLIKAGTFAERLRLHVAETPLQRDQQSIRMTVSIGIALMDSGATGPESSLTLADRALYTAKQAGRNRVEKWELSPKPL